MVIKEYLIFKCSSLITVSFCLNIRAYTEKMILEEIKKIWIDKACGFFKFLSTIRD